MIGSIIYFIIYFIVLETVPIVQGSTVTDQKLLEPLVRPDSAETENSGPRVKHVSRSAHMAQGEPAVVQPTDIRLSALPPGEKCKIWNEKSLLTDYSDDEIEESKARKLDYDW